jgi:hypothetical protein
MTMQDHDDPILSISKRLAWNKGKLIGAKPPLQPKQQFLERMLLDVTTFEHMPLDRTTFAVYRARH